MNSAASNDYWANEFDAGTASTWRFQGRTGLERLSGPAAISSDDPAAFHAELTRVQLDHVALESLSASAHQWVRGGLQIDRYPTPVLTFLLVQEGTAEVSVNGTTFPLAAGQALVVDSRDPFRYTASAPLKTLRSVVGVEHVPARLQASGASVAAALPQTPLTVSFIAFISSILATTSSGHQARGDQLVSSVADLQNAVLAEAQQAVTDPEGAAGTRWRMEEYIDEHFTDPNLDQHGVARALGISLHRARAVFNDGPHTIPHFIRDRRVAAAALELRTTRDAVSFKDLARRHGFGSTDSLTRAFRERFGATPREYQEHGHHNLG